jgi:hypothetical protein
VVREGPDALGRALDWLVLAAGVALSQAVR